MADELDLAADALSMRVTSLAGAVAGVLDLDPIAAARRAPRLIDETKAVMAAVRKAAIAAVAGTMTHAEIAAELGVSPSAVNNAIVEHRARATLRGVSGDTLTGRPDQDHAGRDQAGQDQAGHDQADHDGPGNVDEGISGV